MTTGSFVLPKHTLAGVPGEEPLQAELSADCTAKYKWGTFCVSVSYLACWDNFLLLSSTINVYSGTSEIRTPRLISEVSLFRRFPYVRTGNNSGLRTLVRIVEVSVIGGVRFRRFHCTRYIGHHQHWRKRGILDSRLSELVEVSWSRGCGLISPNSGRPMRLRDSWLLHVHSTSLQH